MGRKGKKDSSFIVAKKLQRKLALQQGFYDGRYREKVVVDKKKEDNRKKARGKIKKADLEE